MFQCSISVFERRHWHKPVLLSTIVMKVPYPIIAGGTAAYLIPAGAIASHSERSWHDAGGRRRSCHDGRPEQELGTRAKRASGVVSRARATPSGSSYPYPPPQERPLAAVAPPSPVAAAAAAADCRRESRELDAFVARQTGAVLICST